jgi:glyceraldehyde 3-phosphate dehydrogenase
MVTRVGINGYGRIGRLVHRVALLNPRVEIVAVNDVTDACTNAHLLQYDSVHGCLQAEITAREGFMAVNGKEIKVLAEKDPAKIPWQEFGVDIVVESSGLFTNAEKAAAHLVGGAKKVIISAPAKNEDITIVMGVNEDQYHPVAHRIISNASCTTNCLAPIVKVLHQCCHIKRGLMTTVHSYTNDQRTLDQAHKDLRRARAAALSIIPTTTGAAKAVALVIPELKGKLNGFAMRVPTPNVSVVDLVAEVEWEVTVESLNDMLKKAAQGPLKGILAFNELPLVSRDFNGNSHSGIVDALSTMVLERNLIKVVAWYDNEWGYSHRILDLAVHMGVKGL